MNILRRLVNSIWTALFDAIILWVCIALLFMAIMLIPQIIFDFEVIDVVSGPYKEYGFKSLYFLCFLTYLTTSKPLTEIISNSSLSFRKKQIIEE